MLCKQLLIALACIDSSRPDIVYLPQHLQSVAGRSAGPCPSSHLRDGPGDHGLFEDEVSEGLPLDRLDQGQRMRLFQAEDFYHQGVEVLDYGGCFVQTLETLVEFRDEIIVFLRGLSVLL